MKFNVILFFYLNFVNLKVLAQPFNSINVSLINQVDVETFLTQNGACTEIVGDLVIGNGVEHLNGISNLQFVSINTVKSHINNIFIKLDVHSKIQLNNKLRK